MSFSRSRAIATVAILTLLLPTVAFATGGSGSHYTTQQGGEIEFYPNGQVKKIKGNATCTGAKVAVQSSSAAASPPSGSGDGASSQASANNGPGNSSSVRQAVRARYSIQNGAAYGHIAIQIPIGATVASIEPFTDPTLSTPLMVNGELVVFSPKQNVAAEAEAFAGPAQPGFVWKGFRSNPLLENVTGTFNQNFTWVYSFDEGSYPDPGQIGPHSIAVYVSDNAESPDPLLEWHTIY